MTNLNINVLNEAGYYGHVITRKLPKDLDNRLYTMIHLIGGFTTRDVSFFADQATEEEVKYLHRLVRSFPSMMKDLLPFAGSYRMLTETKEYLEIVDMIKFNEPKEELIESTITDGSNPYITRYITEKGISALFGIWDNIGSADYDMLRIVGVKSEDPQAFDNIIDVLYPLLRLEWEGGYENTQMYRSKDIWQTYDPSSFHTKLIYKSEPIGFDYMFDESESFGEQGYSCWSLNVYIDVNKSISFDDGYIQEMFDVDEDTTEILDINNSGNDSEGDELLWDLVKNNGEYGDYFNSYCEMNVYFV